MSAKHTYATTYEQTDHLDNVIASAEVRFTYTFTPGTPETGRYSGPPENYDPGSGPEVHIETIEVEDFGKDGKPYWRTATEDEADRFGDWAELSLEDELIEHAGDTLDAEEDRAAEYRMEAARERRLFGGAA